MTSRLGCVDAGSRINQPTECEIYSLWQGQPVQPVTWLQRNMIAFPVWPHNGLAAGASRTDCNRSSRWARQQQTDRCSSQLWMEDTKLLVNVLAASGASDFTQLLIRRAVGNAGKKSDLQVTSSTFLTRTVDEGETLAASIIFSAVLG